MPTETSRRTQDIETILQAYETALNGSDIETILGLYGASPVFMPQNAPALVGRDAVRAGYSLIVTSRSVSFAELLIHRSTEPDPAMTVSCVSGAVTYPMPLPSGSGRGSGRKRLTVPRSRKLAGRRALCDNLAYVRYRRTTAPTPSRYRPRYGGCPPSRSRDFDRSCRAWLRSRDPLQRRSR